mgnify:CR=1 FL=1
MNYNVLGDKIQINETGEIFIFVANLARPVFLPSI